MYAATLGGRRLTFEVAAVWRRNMIVRDLETKSLWQQATGECLCGPLEGATLEPLGGEIASWAAWRREHPSTTVALEPVCWEGVVSKATVVRVLDRATRHVGLVPGLTPTDRRLPPLEEIAGVVVAGAARAYPIAILRERGRIEDRLGGRQITVEYDPAADRVRAFADAPGDPRAGIRPLLTSRQRWAGWYEFHPGTEVYTDLPSGGANPGTPGYGIPGGVP